MCLLFCEKVTSWLLFLSAALCFSFALSNTGMSLLAVPHYLTLKRHLNKWAASRLPGPHLSRQPIIVSSGRRSFLRQGVMGGYFNNPDPTIFIISLIRKDTALSLAHPADIQCRILTK